MNFSPTSMLFLIAPVLGFSMTWTVADIVAVPFAEPAPAMTVNEIVIREDGSMVYDRTVHVTGVWQAWSGQIFDDRGVRKVHCRGGELSQYFGPVDDPESKDVDWLVGGNCIEGLEAGMTFVFTWTPIGDDYAPIRYPEEGYGVVQPAN